MNGFVWNYISYDSAKEVAEHTYTTSKVQSGLITGKQWDTMVKFIAQLKNDDTNGNEMG